MIKRFKQQKVAIFRTKVNNSLLIDTVIHSCRTAGGWYTAYQLACHKTFVGICLFILLNNVSTENHQP